MGGLRSCGAARATGIPTRQPCQRRVRNRVPEAPPAMAGAARAALDDRGFRSDARRLRQPAAIVGLGTRLADHEGFKSRRVLALVHVPAPAPVQVQVRVGLGLGLVQSLPLARASRSWCWTLRVGAVAVGSGSVLRRRSCCCEGLDSPVGNMADCGTTDCLSLCLKCGFIGCGR